MKLSGIQKFTLIDYPEKTSAIAFIPGCDFRCGYCHNSEFVLPELIKKIHPNFISESAFFNFLKKRQGLLDGVVISGGEPTINPELANFIIKIKSFGFLVKLDTNGNNPHILKKLINHKLVDYIAMDIKTSLDDYKNLVGPFAKPENILKSINLIKKSSKDYEFRSTLIKEIHTPKILKEMAKLISGAKILYLQKFRSAHTLDPSFEKYHAFSDFELTRIKNLFLSYIKKVEIR